MKGVVRLFASLCLTLALGCNSSDVEEAVDIADGVPRKTVPQERLGVNAFANDSRFGTPSQQFNDVRRLGLRWVRVLFSWDDNVQSSPSKAPFFGFYDDVLSAIPQDMKVLVILTGVPRWVNNSANWVGGSARSTFVDQWVRPVVERYKDDPRVEGFQIWNEPNMVENAMNSTLDVATSPTNYVEMLALAHNVIKDVAPDKLVVSAATTAINQNYPSSLDYNRAMRDAGAQNFLDVWGVHYYGKQFENVVRSNGVRDFLEGLSSRIWITESGERGVSSQLAYAEQVWPFLLDKIPEIERIYIYQYSEDESPATTYGLRNTSSTPLSDLYVWLRDN